MRTVISFILLISALIAGGCKTQQGWVTQVGGANREAAFGLAATDDGRACITGTFISVVDFGTQAKPLQLDSGGYSDIFVACYDDAGDPVFVTAFGVTQKNDQPRAIAAAPGGDVIVTGFFSRTFGREPGPVLEAPGRANADLFVARLDRRGNTVWARSFGGSRSESGRALAVDDGGNIYVAGTFNGTFPYAVSGVGQKLTSAGLRDALLMRLDADGEPRWARQFGGERDDEAFAVLPVGDDTVIVAGTFGGSARVPGGETLTAVGYNDVFIQAYTADGELKWSRSFGGSGQEHVGGLARSTQGGVWLAGSFQNSIAFGDGTTLTSNGSTDAFLVHVDAAGRFDRVLGFGGAGVELLYGIASAADGSLRLAGHFQTEADLAPGAGQKIYRAAGANDTDAFLLHLDAEGRHLAGRVLTGDDVAVANGIAIAADGSTIATGIFGNRLVFGSGPDAALESRGKSDIFVLRGSPQ